MGDRFLAALVIAALVVLTGWAIHGLSRYNDRLDGNGDAGQASGSPTVCGGHGPAGMRCDRPPHDAFERCEENGIGWRSTHRGPADTVFDVTSAPIDREPS